MADFDFMIARVLAFAALCLAGAGCNKGEDPFLAAGDINGAEVRYSSDRGLADNVAQRHCRQYERVARFVGYGEDTAFYECDIYGH